MPICLMLLWCNLFDRLAGKESLLHAPCWNLSGRKSGLSYTPRSGICLFVWRVGSLYYMPRAVICLVVRWEGSLYYTARDRICLVLGRWGVSLTRPVLKSVWSYVV